MTSKTTAQPAPAADGARVRDSRGRYVGAETAATKKIASRGPTVKRKPRDRAGLLFAVQKEKKTIVRWSQEREDMFLEVLAQTANVRSALRVAGFSDSNVYRKRSQSAAFRARWAAALREGFVKLETEMLRRALDGTEKPVFHQGKLVATITEYDNRIGLALLSAHRDAVMGTAPIAPALSEAEMRKALADRLSEMNRNMGGNG